MKTYRNILSRNFRTFLALEQSQRGPTHVGYDGKILCRKELILTSKMASALLKVLKQSVALLKVLGGI